MLGEITDGRRTQRRRSELVAASVFFAGLLRIRSFNALEPRLKEKCFLRLVEAREDEPLGSADTLSRTLRVMDLDSVRAVSVEMLK